MLRTDHRSVSQMNTFLSCPKKYEYAYIKEGINIMTDCSAKSLGSALHKAQEFNYRQKIKSKKDLPLEEIDTFMLEFLMTEFLNNKENPNFFKVKYGKRETGEQIIATAQRMLKTLYEEVMVKTQPLFVEMPVTLSILGQDFLLYIDLIDEDYVIRDLKTSGQRYPEGAIELNTQLIGYALAFRVKFGRKEKAVQLDVVTKAKTPIIQQLRTKVTDANISRFLNTLDQVNRAIEAKIFPPVDNKMTCSWCDFKDLCAEDGGLPDAKVMLERIKEIKEKKAIYRD